MIDFHGVVARLYALRKVKKNTEIYKINIKLSFERLYFRLSLNINSQPSDKESLFREPRVPGKASAVFKACTDFMRVCIFSPDPSHQPPSPTSQK